MPVKYTYSTWSYLLANELHDTLYGMGIFHTYKTDDKYYDFEIYVKPENIDHFENVLEQLETKYL